MFAQTGLELFRGIERLLLAANIPVLLYIGYKLFDHGVLQPMLIEGEHRNSKLRLTQVAPGTFCFILAVILGVYAILHGIEPGDRSVNDENGTQYSYLDGGMEARTPLTTELLDRGCQALACELGNTGDSSCLNELRAKLRAFPTLQDLRNLARLEEEAAAGTKEALAALEMEKARIFK